MLRIQVFFVGKERAGWLQEGLTQYGTRIQGKISLNWIACSDDARLISGVKKERRVLGLDPQGELVDSEAFSRLLFDNLGMGGSRLGLAIGGPDGLPRALKEELPLISLSRLTFTHELARLVLAEQIYRALEIRSGSPYHK